MDAPSVSGSSYSNSKRFVKTTETDRDAILTNVVPQNTVRNTKYAVKVFKAWLNENYQSDEFELLTDENLNEMLSVFYAEVRSEKGERLSRSTLNTIRGGINRHLESPPYKRNVDIPNNPVFSTSNKMFFSILKKTKEEGADKTKHWPHIEEKDLEKILSEEAFDLHNPKELQLKVFFDIQYNFARRGRENLREMKRNNFKFKKDDIGREYAEFDINEATKNHQNFDDRTQKQLMYATGKVNCPVNCLKFYISKLDPTANSLYCKPIIRKSFSADDNVWYTAVPIGKNTLGNYMKIISSKLKLSQSYTNHSIRATVVTLLSRTGFESREIMRLTGHKSEASLRSYDKENSAERKREISDTLNLQKKNRSSSSTSSSTYQRRQTFDLDTTDSDDMLLLEAVDEVVNVDMSDSTTAAINNANQTRSIQTPTSTSTSCMNELKNLSMSLMNKQFNVSHMEHCTFNFNINVSNNQS